MVPYPDSSDPRYVPLRYRFCNRFLRTPIIGSLFVLFYFYCTFSHLPGWFVIIFGMVITTVGFFTAILNVFGGILLGVISFFFLDQYVDGALALYAVVSVIYIFVLVNNFVLIKRLANGEYVRSLITGQIIRNYTRDGL